jgi:pimeloyl-ACP methyl ester carboxylesterase
MPSSHPDDSLSDSALTLVPTVVLPAESDALYFFGLGGNSLDYQHILTLIAALSGNPSDEFATLKAGGADPKVPIGQILCPRPMPANEIEGQTVFCGTVQVPEDHADPGGKQITLKFSILKSWSQYPEPDPVVFLQGGPGGSAISQIPLYAGSFDAFRATRDVVLWDQRSAGLSGGSVKCYGALAENAALIATTPGAAVDPGSATSIVGECLAETEMAGIDIAKYNTTENARDLRTLTRALGYETYNIYGISYGTKLALEAMRVVPEGIRSVVIDGVAPSWLPLYESLALKFSEPIEHLVEQCKADAVCNTTFPRLDEVFIDTLNKAKEGMILHQGKPITVELIYTLIDERNGKYGNQSMTPFIPAFIYELNRGQEMPTVDLLVGRNFVMPMIGDEDVVAAAASLPKRQRDLIAALADHATIVQRVDRSNGTLMEDLRDDIDATRNYGPVAILFDGELQKALIAATAGDAAKAESAVSDYVALQNTIPSRESLRAFVTAHTSGEASARLVDLIDSMSEAELAGSFAIIRRDAERSETGLFENLYLFNYACQEDVPFNTLEGYRAFTASQKYPHIGDVLDPLAEMVFGACAAFTPQQRDNWQLPVESDIPTLSIGGLFDTQTPASWSQRAVEKLSNAQVFMIPEAGHGSILYQPCVSDMGVAFINDPQRKLSDACPRSITFAWHIPDWAKTAQ